MRLPRGRNEPALLTRPSPDMVVPREVLTRISSLMAELEIIRANHSVRSSSILLKQLLAKTEEGRVRQAVSSRMMASEPAQTPVDSRWRPGSCSRDSRPKNWSATAVPVTRSMIAAFHDFLCLTGTTGNGAVSHDQKPGRPGLRDLGKNALCGIRRLKMMKQPGSQLPIRHSGSS